MIDDDTYRTAKVNIHLFRVYKGDALVGQVRMGLDGKWYPELPATQFRTAAVHKLVLAHEALVEFSDEQR